MTQDGRRLYVTDRDPDTVHGYAIGADGELSALPGSPHLWFAGVAPERQGAGLGSALMRPVLDRCDADRVPAYLDATTPLSRRLYERHGFEVTGEVQVSGGGPRFWPMWREPS